MERRLRLRWLMEAVLFVVALGLFVLTLAWPEWIEEVFGVEPDGGSGALEWLIAIGFLVVAVLFAWDGRRTHRRWRALASAS